MFGSEELFGAVDGESFDFINKFAAAVVAFAGVAFGVFVGEDGAERFEDSRGDEVFGGDHFKAGLLAVEFFLNGLFDTWIEI